MAGRECSNERRRVRARGLLAAAVPLLLTLGLAGADPAGAAPERALKVAEPSPEELRKECIHLLEEGGVVEDCVEADTTVVFVVALAELVVLVVLVALAFRLPWRRSAGAPVSPEQGPTPF